MSNASIFLGGLFIPMAVLAGAGVAWLLSQMAKNWERALSLAVLLLFGFTSNALVLAALLRAPSSSDPAVYLSNDEVAALSVEMTVRTREEVLEGLIGEVASEICASSDEVIRAELDELYAKNPKLFVEHLRKQGADRVKGRIETAKRLGLNPNATTKLIAAGLRS